MQQVAGPFRGRAKTEQLFGVRRSPHGSGYLPEERQPPDPPNGGCPLPVQLFANPEVQTQLLLRLVRVVRFKKKIKKCFLLLTRVAMTAIYNESTEKEGVMPKLGFAFATIGMLLLVLLTGVEPTSEAAFWIHAGMMWIGVMTLGLGAALMYKK